MTKKKKKITPKKPDSGDTVHVILLRPIHIQFFYPNFRFVRWMCIQWILLKKMKVNRFGHCYNASQFSTWDHDFGHVTELCCKANKWDSFLQYFAQPLSTATTNFYFFFVPLLLQFFLRICVSLFPCICTRLSLFISFVPNYFSQSQINKWKYT